MFQLSCENKFCIYQNQGNCMLESVQLDNQGSCIDCISIHIEEEALSNLKENLLKNLQDFAQ